MHRQELQEPLKEKRESDLNASQGSSGIDVSCEDMSPQTIHQDNDVQKSSNIKPIQVLQKALDKLGDKVSDLNIPENTIEWQQLYENTLFQSIKHALSYEEHLGNWIQLIISAIQSKDTEQTILNSYCNALSMLPLKIHESDTTWVSLLNGLYSHIIEGEISKTSAAGVLETAEKKFKYSPKHARFYWNAVLKNEKRLIKKLEENSLEQIHKIVNLYKTRFSNPYHNMEEDYSEYARWAIENNVSKDLSIEVQQTFLQHSRMKSMDFVTKILDSTLGKNNELKHHILFENWVFAICNEDSPSYDNIEIICEEMIATEPESICFYWVFLQALASSKFEGNSKRDEKIYDIILRGFRLGKTSCVGVDLQFLEYSLVIASKTLDFRKVLELVEAALSNTQFSLINNQSKWYASSRGVIISISNLIHAGFLDKGNFEIYFEKVIAPCTMEFFQNSFVPQELVNLTGYETHYFELVRLWVGCMESYYQMPWEKTLEMWTKIFMNNENPILLVGYTDFVRNRGSLKEAFEAINFALGQMAAIERSESTQKRTTRRCYIKLLKDRLEILSTSGDIYSQIPASNEFQQKLNYYISESFDDFYDIITPGLTISGFSPYESLWSSSLSGSEQKLSQESVKTCDTSFSDISIVKQMKSLKVDLGKNKFDSKTSTNNGDSIPMHKVFISNLNYNATEEDVFEAFKDKGLIPLNIEIKKDQSGKSRGMAHVSFETKELADRAIKVCDKFKVGGRVTFVSEFKRGQKTITKPNNPQPTVINLSNLPDEWKDKDKISNKLQCYGHLKSISVEGKDVSFTSRVEFHLAEDAINTYDQIVENKLFGEDVACRLGYASSKRQTEEKKPSKGKKSVKKALNKPLKKSEPEVVDGRNEETSLPSLANGTEKNQVIGPQIPLDFAKEKLKPKPKRAFIPNQVLKQDLPRVQKRTHMKTRLDFGEPGATTSATVQDSPEKKIMRLSDERIKPNPTSDDEAVQEINDSSTSSSDSPSPKKKLMRMTTDLGQDMSKLPRAKLPDVKDSFPSSDGTNVDMEEENCKTTTKKFLSNKDFQQLFKKH